VTPALESAGLPAAGLAMPFEPRTNSSSSSPSWPKCDGLPPSS